MAPKLYLITCISCLFCMYFVIPLFMFIFISLISFLCSMFLYLMLHRFSLCLLLVSLLEHLCLLIPLLFYFDITIKCWTDLCKFSEKSKYEKFENKELVLLKVNEWKISWNSAENLLQIHISCWLSSEYFRSGGLLSVCFNWRNLYKWQMLSHSEMSQLCCLSLREQWVYFRIMCLLHCYLSYCLDLYLNIFLKFLRVNWVVHR